MTGYYDYVFDFNENYGMVEYQGKLGFVSCDGEITPWSLDDKTDNLVETKLDINIVSMDVLALSIRLCL